MDQQPILLAWKLSIICNSIEKVSKTTLVRRCETRASDVPNFHPISPSSQFSRSAAVSSLCNMKYKNQSLETQGRPDPTGLPFVVHPEDPTYREEEAYPDGPCCEISMTMRSPATHYSRSVIRRKTKFQPTKISVDTIGVWHLSRFNRPRFFPLLLLPLPPSILSRPRRHHPLSTLLDNLSLLPRLILSGEWIAKMDRFPLFSSLDSALSIHPEFVRFFGRVWPTI